MKKYLLAGSLAVAPFAAQAQSTPMVLAFKAWDNHQSLYLGGDISFGDEARLEKALYNAIYKRKEARPIKYLYLNSPGGNVIASTKMGAIIRAAGIVTVVVNKAECASACFNLFSAGVGRYFGPEARIGVHSGSIDGTAYGTTRPIETEGTTSRTLFMARWLKDAGVPPGILGKLVITEPTDMAWLKYSDLIEGGFATYQAAFASQEPTPPPEVHIEMPYAPYTPYVMPALPKPKRKK